MFFINDLRLLYCSMHLNLFLAFSDRPLILLHSKLSDTEKAISREVPLKQTYYASTTNHKD